MSNTLVRTGIHTVEATMECLSGFRIGGSQDDLQIGGTDLPVIKHPVTLAPYVPGSSLKGRMRAELEKQRGISTNDPCGCAKMDCPVCRLFGPHKRPEHLLGPSRLLVRDGHLAEGGEIEIKSETAVDRRTGTGRKGSLRQMERVAAGSKFNIVLTLQVYNLDEDFHYDGKRGSGALLAAIRNALRLVEQTGLGGGTSRGSGHVRFLNLKLDGNPWT